MPGGYLGELGKQRVAFAQLLKVRYGGKGKLYLGVDELFAALYIGKVERGIHNCVEAAYVGEHSSGVEPSGGHHFDSLLHVAGVSAGGADYMGIEVMHVVEVELRLKIAGGRPGKEVEAAVKAEYGVGLLHHRPYRGKAYHVVVAGAAGELPQVLSAEARLGGVYEVKLHALLLGVLYRIYAPCAGKAVVVYIWNRQTYYNG